VAGLVRKKKARVMWKKEREVRIVLADIRAMVAGCAAKTQEAKCIVVEPRA
jgi:hypothetical protein